MRYKLNIELEDGEKLKLDFDLMIEAMEMAGEIFGVSLIHRFKELESETVSLLKHDGKTWQEVATITEEK
jgi:hypothetical protein